jgi:hypothetical protein
LNTIDTSSTMNTMRAPLVLLTNLAYSTGELMLASAEAIARRMESIVSPHSPLRQSAQRELALLEDEKMGAVTESAQAVCFGMVIMQQKIATLAFKEVLAGTVAVMSVAASRMTPQSIARQAEELVGHAVDDAAYATSTITGAAERLAREEPRSLHARAQVNLSRNGKSKHKTTNRRAH